MFVSYNFIGYILRNAQSEYEMVINQYFTSIIVLLIIYLIMIIKGRRK